MKKMVEAVDSRTKIQKVFDEEEQMSQNFKISNFYSNHRLNMVELKNRLEQFKKKHNQLVPPFKVDELSREIEPEVSFPQPTKYAAYSSAEAPLEKEKITLPPAHRQRLSAYDEGGGGGGQSKEMQFKPKVHSFESAGSKKHQEVKQTNHRILKQVRRYDGKIRTASGNRQSSLHPRSVHSHYEKQPRFQRSKNQTMDLSHCSHSSNKRSVSESSVVSLEGKFLISDKSQLVEFQKQITTLWGHYQLLTKILLGLRSGEKHQKNAIVKYVEDVCLDRFQFIKSFLARLTREGAQKGEQAFVKRLKRTLVLSRLLENMAIVYVGLAICSHRPAESHLVNFVGYCCSNITFMIRLAYLLHSVDGDCRLSAPVAHIMNVIGEFEEQSYKESIARVSDIVLRMEHNNEIISIVQTKLCSSLDKDFQKIIVSFLKNVDLNSKSFCEYAHYIYEFLAYELGKKGIIGEFSFLEMAPSPYMEALPKQKTVVIEPWQVLLAFKGTTTYIRSYCDTFLREIAKYCNIIYWTDLMPDFIDKLIDKLPPGKILYRYHCRYENDRHLKLLWRLGTDSDNTIIIDREEANFKYDKDMGVALPWLGKKKDNKLLELLGQLHHFLTEDAPLRKVFPLIKQALAAKKKESRLSRESQSRQDVQSMLPRAMTKPKKGSRFGHYQH